MTKAPQKFIFTSYYCIAVISSHWEVRSCVLMGNSPPLLLRALLSKEPCSTVVLVLAKDSDGKKKARLWYGCQRRTPPFKYSHSSGIGRNTQTYFKLALAHQLVHFQSRKLCTFLLNYKIQFSVQPT